MRRKRSLYVILYLAAFALVYVGSLLLGQAINDYFSHLSTNPLLLVGKFCLALTMLCSGIWGMVKMFRNHAAWLANYSSRDSDVQGVFRRIQTNEIPPDWSVFRAARRKVIGRCVAIACAFLPALLLFGAMVWFAISSPTPLHEKFMMCIFLCIVLAQMIFVQISLWKDGRSKVLVITPDAFVYGNHDKPQKAIRLSFRDIEDIKISGESVTVVGRNNRGRLSLEFALLATRLMEIVKTLRAAFVYSKASYLAGEFIDVPPVFVDKKREKQWG